MLGQLHPSSLNDVQPKGDLRISYRKHTTNDITDPVVWNEKGNIHFNSQDFREATVSYNNAIKIDPSYGQPYHNLALIQSIQGNFDDAILLYQKSIRLLITDREKAIAWNGLGNLYRRKKEYEKAVQAYQRASEIDKDFAIDFEKPIVFAVNEEQRTPNFWLDLGKILYNTGAYSKASSAFQKAIKLDPSSAQAYSLLARVLTAQGQYEEAISLHRKSIELSSNKKERANAWNRLGDAYRKLNDYDNALKAYKNATKLTEDKFSILNRARLSLLSNCITK